MYNHNYIRALFFLSHRKIASANNHHDPVVVTRTLPTPNLCHTALSYLRENLACMKRPIFEVGILLAEILL